MPRAVPLPARPAAPRPPPRGSRPHPHAAPAPASHPGAARRARATTPAVSPDGKWISFRLCDEVYWRDGATGKRTYQKRRADKRPVWVMGSDGTNPHVIEALHYQTTIDGSRAPWRPKAPNGNSPAGN